MSKYSAFTYKDIIKKHNAKLVDDKCLIWSSDYECKPVYLTDNIHKYARWAWFQVEILGPEGPEIHIFKFERKPKEKLYYFHKTLEEAKNFKVPKIHASELWKLVETGMGNIDFTHRIAFSDKMESVFD